MKTLTWAEMHSMGMVPREPWNKGRSKYASEEERRQAARDRARAWAAANPDRVRAKQRRYNRSEKGRAKQREWRAAHREHLAEYKRRWAERNPESARASRSAYYYRHVADIKARRLRKLREERGDGEMDKD